MVLYEGVLLVSSAFILFSPSETLYPPPFSTDIDYIVYVLHYGKRLRLL